MYLHIHHTVVAVSSEGQTSEDDTGPLLPSGVLGEPVLSIGMNERDMNE